MQGFHFLVLTPEQQHRATEIRAHEIHKEEKKRAERRDWAAAEGKLFASGNQHPTREEIRPVAHALYEQRMAADTPESREKAKLANWLQAERELRTTDIYDGRHYGLPTIPFGEYKFSELNPDQQHLAIQQGAESISRWHVIHRQEEDWFKAAEQVQKRTGQKFNAAEVIRPIAQAISAERSTETNRKAAEVEDWLSTERYYSRPNQTVALPVAAVPQLKPRWTFQALER